jgi:thiol:disulfide interchange protein
MNRACVCLALIASAGLSAGALAQNQKPAPQVMPPAKQLTPKSIKPAPAKKSQPRKEIYNVSADAREQIAAAVSKAKAEDKRVLLQWGGNWCGWCHLLHNTFENDEAVAKNLANEYVVVLVDAGGQTKKNLDLAAEYKAELNKHGYPYLTVLDADGKVVANQETASLETPKPAEGEYTPGHDAKKVLNFLTKHQVYSQPAEVALGEALTEAEKSGRLVFVHFGAPWCGWCHKLEAWMAQPEVKAALEKDFVDLKIDVDRRPGGKELSERLGATGGIPWFAFISPKGAEKIATSTGLKGNTGFPYQPEEVEHFAKMLEKAAKKMTPAERAMLVKSLNENREREEAKRPKKS